MIFVYINQTNNRAADDNTIGKTSNLASLRRFGYSETDGYWQFRYFADFLDFDFNV